MLKRPNRLLLVEDDHLVRDTITFMLEDEYDVLSVVSAPDAVALVQGSKRFDLILLDCLLPHGKVADVLAVADRQAIPVVLISGDPNQAEALEPDRRFLPKQFSRASLLSILDSARG